MSERLVEIPVNRMVREKIKTRKGIMSYSEFLEKVIDDLQQ